MVKYRIEEAEKKRVLIIGEKRHETNYSKNIIELIIKRKGVEKTPEYFVHKEKRKYLLEPLFKYLAFNKLTNLKVLEVGCSAGQFTELLDEQQNISEIFSFDVDRMLTEVAKAKVQELGLKKVKRVDCFSNQETLALPYQNNYFDLIILSGVLEHLPFENRHLYVDEYYRKLKTGGLICFLDTPNRNYFMETHSIGLPFISKFPPQAAFIYAKLLGKLKNSDFTDFVRAGTAWRNATYYECLPHSLAIEVKDISEQSGYGYSFFKKTPRSIKFRIFLAPFFSFLRFLSLRLNYPVSFFLPDINIVFKKEINYEKE